MADLKKIQDCIDQLAVLIGELQSLPADGGTQSQMVKAIQWKADADEAIRFDVPNYCPEIVDFNRHWRMPSSSLNRKAALIKKLRNAQADLKNIISIQEELELIPSQDAAHNRLC